MSATHAHIPIIPIALKERVAESFLNQESIRFVQDRSVGLKFRLSDIIDPARDFIHTCV